MLHSEELLLTITMPAKTNLVPLSFTQNTALAIYKV